MMDLITRYRIFGYVFLNLLTAEYTVIKHKEFVDFCETVW